MMTEEDCLAHSIRDRKKLLKKVLGAEKVKKMDKPKYEEN
jgi:hypothetical protein